MEFSPLGAVGQTVCFCLPRYPLLSLLNSVLVDVTSYVQTRLAIKWRWNVTEKLHSMYFSRMAYLRLGGLKEV